MSFGGKSNWPRIPKWLKQSAEPVDSPFHFSEWSGVGHGDSDERKLWGLEFPIGKSRLLVNEPVLQQE